MKNIILLFGLLFSSMVKLMTRQMIDFIMICAQDFFLKNFSMSNRKV